MRSPGPIRKNMSPRNRILFYRISRGDARGGVSILLARPAGSRSLVQELSRQCRRC